MNSVGLTKFRVAAISLLGVFCISGSFSSRFVHPWQTPHASLAKNIFITLFGVACFIQAYVLRSELNSHRVK